MILLARLSVGVAVLFLIPQWFCTRVLNMDSYTFADFTVLMILPAILYGSPLDAGLLSSNQPFQPFSTVMIGIRIEAPLSEMP